MDGRSVPRIVPWAEDLGSLVGPGSRWFALRRTSWSLIRSISKTRTCTHCLTVERKTADAASAIHQRAGASDLEIAE